MNSFQTPFSTTATVDPAPSIGPWTTGAVSAYPLTMGIRIQCVNIDCHDPSRLARFWEDALGWRRTYEEGDEVVLEPPEGSPEERVVPDLVFFRVPEDKTLKNRLHFDLRPDDQGAEVQRLIRLGARHVSIGQAPDSLWVVLADPEGNEFCVLKALAG